MAGRGRLPGQLLGRLLMLAVVTTRGLTHLTRQGRAGGDVVGLASGSERGHGGSSDLGVTDPVLRPSSLAPSG